jgi:hypothetical protein
MSPRCRRTYRLSKTALEGDVPKEIHRAVRETEAKLEYIRFGVNAARERDEVEKALQQLEPILASHGAV